MKRLKVIKESTRRRKPARHGVRRAHGKALVHAEVHEAAENVLESARPAKPQESAADILLPFIQFPFVLMMAIGDTIGNLIGGGEAFAATTPANKPA
ncbi:MAG TPA: hypothetical protein VL285_14940 [Bryobacteraceae bacterium]|nr:hypothetical protein [Bryobacteraceae bacterium]